MQIPDLGETSTDLRLKWILPLDFLVRWASKFPLWLRQVGSISDTCTKSVLTSMPRKNIQSGLKAQVSSTQTKAALVCISARVKRSDLCMPIRSLPYARCLRNSGPDSVWSPREALKRTWPLSGGTHIPTGDTDNQLQRNATSCDRSTNRDVIWAPGEHEGKEGASHGWMQRTPAELNWMALVCLYPWNYEMFKAPFTWQCRRRKTGDYHLLSIHYAPCAFY